MVASTVDMHVGFLSIELTFNFRHYPFHRLVPPSTHGEPWKSLILLLMFMLMLNIMLKLLAHVFCPSKTSLSLWNTLHVAQVGLQSVIVCYGTVQCKLFYSESNITCCPLQNSMEEKDKATVKVDSVLILLR